MNRILISTPQRMVSALLALFIVSGCGTAAKDSSFKEDFAPARSTKIVVGEVLDAAPKGERGEQEDFDIASELRTQLEAKLAENEMLSTGRTEEEPYVLNAKIVDYDPGSAAGRWLMPGLGSTELSVQCTLTENGQKVGSIFARRTVEAGGFYTIGAWKSVIGTVADDIVAELKTKLDE